MTEFNLHHRLQADTHFVADLQLCRVLLMNDSRYPWVILVPRQNALREFHDLSTANRHLLMDEISQFTQALQGEFSAEKMNVGALGNMVPQLHIHIIARNSGDTAWPGPVWGVGAATPYNNDDAAALCQRLKLIL